jgi:hypothetical protein
MVENKTMNEIGAQIDNVENVKPMIENRPGLDVPKKITDDIIRYDKPIDLMKLIGKIRPNSYILDIGNAYIVLTN